MLAWLPDGYGGVSSYARDIDAVFFFIYYLTAIYFFAGDGLDGVVSHSATATAGMGVGPPIRMATRRWS